MKGVSKTSRYVAHFYCWKQWVTSFQAQTLSPMMGFNRIHKNTSSTSSIWCLWLSGFSKHPRIAKLWVQVLPSAFGIFLELRLSRDYIIGELTSWTLGTTGPALSPKLFHKLFIHMTLFTLINWNRGFHKAIFGLPAPYSDNCYDQNSLAGVFQTNGSKC